mgnify:FL=1
MRLIFAHFEVVCCQITSRKCFTLNICKRPCQTVNILCSSILEVIKIYITNDEALFHRIDKSILLLKMTKTYSTMRHILQKKDNVLQPLTACQQSQWNKQCHSYHLPLQRFDQTINTGVKLSSSKILICLWQFYPFLRVRQLYNSSFRFDVQYSFVQWLIQWN